MIFRYAGGPVKDTQQLRFGRRDGVAIVLATSLTVEL